MRTLRFLLRLSRCDWPMVRLLDAGVRRCEGEGQEEKDRMCVRAKMYPSCGMDGALDP